ncbi:MAG: methyltransferase domain-containing protein [Brasilonema octagenarum HA4186-MV1]|jgi:SAM-dependent methyltransferase|uniref:SAM-dependent methyltransferase n=2 Tax=Brasilonema TaxID=383614 RepID=A0A856M956_9CYAN|nr:MULTISPECIES: class I SAM-dependent methyltransferase [Brasilonema]MBW4627282.1 methyltransferase domain-containing protein [Brasilonema octagenarum HA4186-MV1]NMF62102.1 SAM-dependent methyltransferase [Brasilonema octagenarum UFV-OR1]QDL06529.1 SAM-dependent methyltransferase [Brasilonema sennae CENA114]QDL12900.1 SAM-dependent methyltransferase [Brasilonema octagenarum UFV-E1]
MSIFNNYARYYDILYRDKDYVGETKFIQQLIQTHAPNAQNILELGCGTGNHAVLLAKEGYQIHGVDLSQEMLQKADSRLSQLHPELASQLKFTHGDIRHLRLNQTFDVILSLFHVISYQITNEDLLAAFTTVKEHLKPGGIFVFDIWYGPAVLTERPRVRVKRLEDEEILVTRIAEPVVHANENLVDVNYQVFIKDKNSNSVNELQETHRMRYLFKPEIELVSQKFQMTILEYQEWMTNREPGFDTWGVYFVIRG